MRGASKEEGSGKERRSAAVSLSRPYMSMRISLCQPKCLWPRSRTVTLSYVPKIQYPLLWQLALITRAFDFLSGSLWFIGHQIRWQLWFLMHRLLLKFTKKRWRPGLRPGPHWGSSQRCPRPLVVYWGSAPDPLAGRWTPHLPSSTLSTGYRHPLRVKSFMLLNCKL
jgi:hypothetical protein